MTVSKKKRPKPEVRVVATSIQTSADLRAALADTMLGVMNGTIDPADAEAINKFATKVNRAQRAQLRRRSGPRT
jgi:hypothetical protein